MSSLQGGLIEVGAEDAALADQAVVGIPGGKDAGPSVPGVIPPPSVAALGGTNVLGDAKRPGVDSTGLADPHVCHVVPPNSHSSPPLHSLWPYQC